jgi:hypothetical protein
LLTSLSPQQPTSEELNPRLITADDDKLPHPRHALFLWTDHNWCWQQSNWTLNQVI